MAEVAPTKSTPTLTYVLVTPAKNEAAYLEATIRSVIQQTMHPLRWVIVSDGSTDATAEIAERYSEIYHWIRVLRLPVGERRDFASKAHAFRAGEASMADLAYDIIGNLDADITFGPDYFAFLLDRFAENPQLGVGGTPFRERDEQYDYRYTSTEHVSGACQLFRRACFEAIGGYVPLRAGGIDLAAVVNARMLGWQTRTFMERTCEHHKASQSGKFATVGRTFRSGYHDWLMGSHPVYQCSRALFRLIKPPYCVGGCALFAGFLWASVTGAERTVTPAFVAFRRAEQLRQLRAILRRGMNRADHRVCP
jgi:glycosyltransferase involved in cell wall biosynthesis